jgi:hypothetical protein
MFRFREPEEGKSLENVRNDLKKKLDALPPVINEIKTFETGININSGPGIWDLVLVSEFENKEDLEKYRVHPAHREVIEFFKTVKDNSASVDYEF